MSIPEDRLTDRQEKFCQLYLTGLTPRECAEQAGYSMKTASEMGAENLSKPKIRNRLAELKKPIEDALINSLIITKESQLKDLEAVKQMAISDKQYKAIISAIAEQNKMLGLYLPEKQEIEITSMPYQINITGTIIE